MGESHLTAPEAASYELALANRKLVTVVMGMTLLMGLVACLAHSAGRPVSRGSGRIRRAGCGGSAPGHRGAWRPKRRKRWPSLSAHTRCLADGHTRCPANDPSRCRARAS
jgi:hypothetical protein